VKAFEPLCDNVIFDSLNRHMRLPGACAADRAQPKVQTKEKGRPATAFGTG
jgi:hypothetical protein